MDISNFYSCNCYFVDVTYIGCYIDNQPRSINGYSTQDGFTSITSCAEDCIVRGYDYFGVQVIVLSVSLLVFVNLHTQLKRKYVFSVSSERSHGFSTCSFPFHPDNSSKLCPPLCIDLVGWILLIQEDKGID